MGRYRLTLTSFRCPAPSPPSYRHQLNVQESRHRLARDVSRGERAHLPKHPPHAVFHRSLEEGLGKRVLPVVDDHVGEAGLPLLHRMPFERLPDLLPQPRPVTLRHSGTPGEHSIGEVIRHQFRHTLPNDQRPHQTRLAA